MLDRYKNLTYADGQAAAIYGQCPPLVNASPPAGRMATYDIIFEAPRFEGDKLVEARRYVTVLHNGVLVQNHQEIIWARRSTGSRPATRRTRRRSRSACRTTASPVRFRNIWIRRLKFSDQK